MAWLSSVADSLGRQHNSRWRTSTPSNGGGSESWFGDDLDGEVGATGTSLIPVAAGDQLLPDEEPELRAVFEAFDASQPVLRPAGLYGRGDQLQRLVNGVLYRRNHGVISGPRGSGKTSLVKVFGERAEAEGLVVLYAANDADASFGLVMRQLLEQIPASSLPAGEDESFQQRVRSLDGLSGAQQVINLLGRLAYSAVVIIIDEFDRVPDQAFRSQMSSLLKLSSDARLRVRFLLVGDEQTFAEVVQVHASLSRHTTHISTGPLSDSATSDLLASCAQDAGMALLDDARQLLVDAVCGSPYHARLFGLHSALRAHCDRRSEISYDDVMGGLEDAFEEWESLNPGDAALFRRLMNGGGDRRLVEAARRLAWRQPPQPGVTVAEQADGDEMLARLAPALTGPDSAPAFRDATAAQFLIARHFVEIGRALHAGQEENGHS